MDPLRQTENLFITLSGDQASSLIAIGARTVEALSTISEMRMEFYSTEAGFDPNTIVGTRIKLETEQGFAWSGIVVNVVDLGLMAGNDVFQAELRPWFWLSQLTENNRIFQNKTTPEIIEAVLSPLGGTLDKQGLTGTHAAREYCVQYGETDFAFVSRLMEEEGIFYFFTYDEEMEKMVLGDDVTVHVDKSDIMFTDANISSFSRADRDTIYEWSVNDLADSSKTSMWDYDFTKASTPLSGTSAKSTGSGSYVSLERYKSTGRFTESDKATNLLARVVSEQHAARAKTATGLTNSTDIRVGNKFNLKYPDRTSVEGAYTVKRCTHFVRFDDGAMGTEMSRVNRQTERLEFPKDMKLYETEFEVIPAATVFRPAQTTPWPQMPSLLTAVVTGPSGEEIYTDSYGRIKVQFPWDRQGQNDENTTCWVRSVMPWTGQGYGMIAVPRIGMEVVIQFERGNPDRPICTGMLFNSTNMPPYPLPDKMNILALRTQSTKGGSASTYHELSFDDTKDSEKVFFQSEKDYEQKIKNNAVITIGMEKADAGDLTQTIKNSKTENIEESDWTLNVKKGSRIINVKTDETKVVEGKSTTTITGDVAETIKEGNVTNEISKGNLDEKIAEGNQTLTISKGNQSQTITKGDVTTDVTAGSVTITAGTKITLKVGPSSIEISPSGITLDAPQLTFKGKKIAVTADVMLDMKGAITNLKADGVVTIKGSMTMVN